MWLNYDGPRLGGKGVSPVRYQDQATLLLFTPLLKFHLAPTSLLSPF